MLVLIGLVVLRFGLRAVLANEAAAWKLDMALITNLFVVFAVGLFAVARLEMWIRARRLLREAKAAPAP